MKTRILLPMIMVAINVQAMDERPFENQFDELTETVKASRLSIITMSHWLEAANALTLRSQNLPEEELLRQLSAPLKPSPKKHPRLMLKKEGSSVSVLAPFEILAPQKTVEAYLQSLKQLKKLMAHPEQLQIAIDQLAPDDHNVRDYITKQQQLLLEAKDLAL